MKKRVSQNSGDLWIQQSQDGREQIKAKLPELILAEPMFVFPDLILIVTHPCLTKYSRKPVRHSSARVVAAIASIELMEGTWPQLLPFIEGACTAPEVQTREVGSYLLFAVLESFGEGIGQHMQSFFKIFEILLQDPESIEVRVTAAKWVSRISYNTNLN